MDQNDIAYFTERADRELEQAQRATDPAAVRAHYILANLYLDKIHGQDGDMGRTAQTG